MSWVLTRRNVARFKLATILSTSVYWVYTFGSGRNPYKPSSSLVIYTGFARFVDDDCAVAEQTPERMIARQARWRRVRLVLAVLIAVAIGVVFVFRFL